MLNIMKRISTRIIVIAAIVAVCAAVYFITGELAAKKTDGYLPEETPQAPLPQDEGNGIIIVLDAGHGGFDGGAVGTDTGVVEAKLNLEVCLILKEELTKNGFTVIMVREDEKALGKNKAEDMSRRKQVISREDIDLVISVHMNKFRDRTIHGPMAFYMKGSVEGQRLAEFVVFALCDSIGHPRRFANPGDYFIVRESKKPAIIVECGFLSNSEDEKKLCDPEYQKLLAYGISNGVNEYYLDKNNTD